LFCFPQLFLELGNALLGFTMYSFSFLAHVICLHLCPCNVIQGFLLSRGDFSGRLGSGPGKRFTRLILRRGHFSGGLAPDLLGMKFSLMTCCLGHLLGPTLNVGLVQLYLASHGFDRSLGLSLGVSLLQLDLASHGFDRSLSLYLGLICLGLRGVHRCDGRVSDLYRLHPGCLDGGPGLGDDLRVRGLQCDVQLLLKELHSHERVPGIFPLVGLLGVPASLSKLLDAVLVALRGVPRSHDHGFRWSHHGCCVHHQGGIGHGRILRHNCLGRCGCIEHRKYRRRRCHFTAAIPRRRCY